MGQRIEKRPGSKLTRLWRNTVKPFWRKYEVPVFIAMGTLAIILGFIGYSEYFRLMGINRPTLDIVFMTFQMFRMMFFSVGPFPWQLEIARWLGATFMLYAAVRVILAVFYEQFQLQLLRWLVTDHVIICGLGQKGDILSEAFYEQGYRVAIVEKSMSKEMAQKCRDRGAVIVSGSALDPQTLLLARVEKAKYLVSVLGDDGANAEVALLARKLVEEKDQKGRALTCYVHIVDRQLCNLLKINYEFNRDRWTNFRMEFFNGFDVGAKALLKEYPPFEGDKDHVVIVGAKRLGESVLLQMATIWLSAHPDLDARFRATIVDRDAQSRIASLSLRYPLLHDTCDLRAFDMSVDVPAFYETPFLCEESLYTATRIYVCMEQDQDSLSAALALNKAAAGHNTPVIVCMSHGSGLSQLIKSGSAMGAIRAFEMMEAVYQPETLLGGSREILAMAIHEEYVQSQLKLHITPSENPSMAPWGSLPETLRESNRHNVDAILVKLSAIGYGIELLTDASAIRFRFTSEEVERMSTIEHERWVDERGAQGWKYAPAKDIDKKLSPYLVPWEQLADDIKEYDRNLVRTLPQFLVKAGFQAYKIKHEVKDGAEVVARPIIVDH